jgi:D-cysteine desulfhydrase
LFQRYPRLADALPYVSLGELPTPVEKLNSLGRDIGLDRLHVKRDDLTGRVYGGNKIRKLEFTLGHALRTGAKRVLTFGYAGSNHALATAACAQQLGLQSISMLMPQPNAHYVRRNLLMSYHCGAELHEYPGKRSLVLGTLGLLLWNRLRYGTAPQVIPPGGSSALGTVGFVNAAFELKEQVERGEMPEPDVIYVPLGTTGTAVGLILGLKAAGMRSRVVPVRVVDKRLMSAKALFEHYSKTNSYIASLDPSFPRLHLSADDLPVVNGFLGKAYAHFTPEGMDAVRRMERSEGLKLDGTYTGKTLAALLDEAGRGGLRDKVVLFWNTLNSRDFSEAISTVDYHDLPRSFHRYFEQDVQHLDRRPEEGDAALGIGG